MYEHLHIDKQGEKIMVRDYHSWVGIAVKNKVFFSGSRTGGVELHYDS